MKTTIEQTYFATKSFPFKCSYHTMIDKTWKISEDNNQEYPSKYIEEVVKGFFGSDEVSFSKTVCKKGESSKWSMYNANYSVFVIEYQNLRRVFETLIFDIRARLFACGGIVSELKTLAKLLRQSLFKSNNDIFWHGFLSEVEETIQKCESWDKNNYYECVDFLMHRNKKWKHQISYHADKIQSKINNNLKQFDMKIHELDGYYSCKSIFKEATLSCIAIISKNGILSISFVADFAKKGRTLEIYDLNDVDCVIKEANRISTTICSRINNLPKLFTFIDLNKLFGFKRMEIIDGLVSNFAENDTFNKMEKYEFQDREKTRKYLNGFSTKKCSHLRFIADDDYWKNKNLMYFYDYVSLLSAFNYSFDSYYLWNVVKNNSDELECDHPIKDYIGKPTEHMYIDGATVLISTINPVVPHSLITNESDIHLPTSSHQSRFYSFWRFKSICNALVYSNFVVMGYHLLDSVMNNYAKYLPIKIIMVYKYHSYVSMASTIESNLNIGFFSAKNDNSIVIEPVFSCFGIDRISRASKERNDAIWQSANISNTQLYNRYGFLFSSISLLITLVSYGLVSAIFVDYQYVKYPIDFFSIVFDTPKFYFILLIASLPLVIWILLQIFGTLISCSKSIIKESKVFRLFTNKKIINLRHEKQPKKLIIVCLLKKIRQFFMKKFKTIFKVKRK